MEAKTIEKELFLNNLGLLFSGRENVFNNFKSRLFPTKNLNKILTSERTREPTLELATEPTKHKKSKLKLKQEFL